MKSYNEPSAELLRIRSEKLLLETSSGVEVVDEPPVNSVRKGSVLGGGEAVSALAGFQPGETNLP